MVAAPSLTRARFGRPWCTSSCFADNTQISCNDSSNCRVKLPTDKALCPTMEVPCNQWVNLYHDKNGNLLGCYAPADGCYNEITMTADANSAHIDLGSGSNSNSTEAQQQEQQQQPPSLLRRRTLALN
jgi:hypothetical protein